MLNRCKTRLLCIDFTHSDCIRQMPYPKTYSRWTAKVKLPSTLVFIQVWEGNKRRALSKFSIISLYHQMYGYPYNTRCPPSTNQSTSLKSPSSPSILKKIPLLWNKMNENVTIYTCTHTHTQTSQGNLGTNIHIKKKTTEKISMMLQEFRWSISWLSCQYLFKENVVLNKFP